MDVKKTDRHTEKRRETKYRMKGKCLFIYASAKNEIGGRGRTRGIDHS